VLKRQNFLVDCFLFKKEEERVLQELPSFDSGYNVVH
jgi:hypothetical protein